VAGIDAVGIGTDIGTVWEPLPPGVSPWNYQTFYESRGFSWHGFRPEHRNTTVRKMDGYQTITDWPNLTLKLAGRGFKEGDLRKILGLNFLNFFRKVVG